MLENQEYNTIDLLQFLFRKRKPILFITIVVAIASIVVSLLITPRFKSAVVIYPASTSSISKALLTDMTMTPKDVMKFGEEEETEQLMQILQSDEIKARIIQKYNLIEHYKINSSAKFYKTALLEKYDQNISSKKTEYQAIEIKVLDTDPEYAAAIANNIADLLDSVYNNIQKERAIKALEVVEKVYRDQEMAIKAIEDSLLILRSNGIYDYQSQTKALSEAYAQALSTGNQSSAAIIAQKIEKLAKYGSAFTSLVKQHEDGLKQLLFLKTKLAEARVDANNDLPHKYVVNRAQVSEKKAYPKRSLIVVFSTIAGFVLAIFVLMLFERFKSLRKELDLKP